MNGLKYHCKDTCLSFPDQFVSHQLSLVPDRERREGRNEEGREVEREEGEGREERKRGEERKRDRGNYKHVLKACKSKI